MTVLGAAAPSGADDGGVGLGMRGGVGLGIAGMLMCWREGGGCGEWRFRGGGFRRVWGERVTVDWRYCPLSSWQHGLSGFLPPSHLVFTFYVQL